MNAPATRSRLRLLVLQALVFSLFATLLVRLYYLQVVDGETYQGKAAAQSVREIVVQPQRGLIVDDQGRPLVTNRLSWVVSLDRTLLGKMTEGERHTLVVRVSKAIDVPVRRIERKLMLCGDDGAVAGLCWNGSPYQPVPVARDLPRGVALRILEQPEDHPGVVVEQQSVRAYPRPFGINAAHLLGYLSPVTEGELTEAEDDGDRSINGASVVGRAGVEQEYDDWLRGMPGYRQVQVDSMGRVLGDDSEVASQPGDTLVTSIDARVQSVVERQLQKMITIARGTHDDVSGKNYVADSGAAVVLEADTGRVVAMAGQPTYDPEVWVNGISPRKLKRLYSQKAGTPLLGRATQGQFAPGSTWKPFMTAAALTHGYSTTTPGSTAPRRSRSATGPSRTTSPAHTATSTSPRPSRSPATRSSTGSATTTGAGSAPTSRTSNARDPLVAGAKRFGFGSETGIDMPGEAPGRIADRRWKRAYYKSQKDYYCDLSSKPQTEGTSDFVYKFAREFCIEGYAYRAGDAVNFAIGQGDTIVTPLQLARAYGAIANGGTLYEPRIGRAVVAPDGTVVRRIQPEVQSELKLPKRVLRYIDGALSGVTRQGTMAWKMGGFPLEQVNIRSKTGSAEVYGKQSTSWVASYSDDYVVVMMISQGGTGSGTSGPGIRAIWESLYGIHGERVDADDAAIPGTVLPEKLPLFRGDGTILPPAVPDRRRGGER